MSYGDYANRTTVPLPKAVEPNASMSPTEAKTSSNTIDSKAATISQQILVAKKNNETISKPLSDHHTSLPSDQNQEIPAASVKANDVGKPILSHREENKESGLIAKNLQHADLARMNSINSQTSKYDSMNKTQLAQALKDPQNRVDIPVIINKLKQLQNQKKEMKNEISTEEKYIYEKEKQNTIKMNDTKTEIKITNVELNETEKLKAALDIKNIRTFVDDGRGNLQFKQTTAEDLKKIKMLFSIDENGELAGTRHDVAKFTIGQAVGRSNDTGQMVPVTINKIRIIDDEEFESYRAAFALSLTNKPADETTNATKNNQTFSSSPISERTREEITTLTKNTFQEKIPLQNSSSAEGKSTSELNEKRFLEFTKYMDKKLAKIKAEIEIREINHTELKATNLANTGKSQENHVESLKVANQNLESLQTENAKLEVEYHQILQTIRDGMSLDIPRAALTSFQKLEVTLHEIIKTIPNSNISSKIETLKESISLKKEVLKVVKEAITPANQLSSTTIGNTGKSTRT